MMLQKIKTYFTTGLLRILPVFLTVLLIQCVVGFTDGVFIPQNIYGGGIIISLVLILTIGACVSTMFDKWIVTLGENILGENIINATAFLRTVYGNAKTILCTVLTNQSSSFNQAVLMQYPYKSAWGVGFGTDDSTRTIGRTANMNAESVKYINVFVSTISNSTSGMLLIADKKDTKALNMSVKEAVQFVLMAGIGKNAKAPKGYK